MAKRPILRSGQVVYEWSETWAEELLKYSFTERAYFIKIV